MDDVMNRNVDLFLKLMTFIKQITRFKCRIYIFNCNFSINLHLSQVFILYGYSNWSCLLEINNINLKNSA
jgi:hypothetical protein